MSVGFLEIADAVRTVAEDGGKDSAEFVADGTELVLTRKDALAELVLDAERDGDE